MENSINLNQFFSGYEPIYKSFLRYVLLAGFFYFLYYVLKKESWIHKKVQKRFPKNENIYYEIKYSLLTLIIVAMVGCFVSWLKNQGFTLMYDHIADYGTPYYIFSIIALILLHDTYFYWGHRFMHLKKIYPYVHKVHHHSTNPTPWASLSFHPLEALIEAGIIPLAVFVLPLHISAIGAFLTFSTIFNVIGHLGYEVFPSGSAKGWTNTVTHHNMHHSLFDCNYGIYFNWWDKIMGTNHETYIETFEKIAEAKPKNKS